MYQELDKHFNNDWLKSRKWSCDFWL